MSEHVPDYELQMPFLPVQSRGGVYDDAAYVAGWEMGRLDANLMIAAAAGLEPDTGILIHPANREQADLIAMKNGFSCEYAPLDEHDEWGRVDILKRIPDEGDEVSADE